MVAVWLSSVHGWDLKVVKNDEPGSVDLCDQESVTANNKFHAIKVDKLIKENRWITQGETAARSGVSQKCIDHIIGFLCVKWVPIHAHAEMKSSKVEIVSLQE